VYPSGTGSVPTSHQSLYSPGSALSPWGNEPNGNKKRKRADAFYANPTLEKWSFTKKLKKCGSVCLGEGGDGPFV